MVLVIYGHRIVNNSCDCLRRCFREPVQARASAEEEADGSSHRAEEQTGVRYVHHRPIMMMMMISTVTGFI